MLQSDIQIYTDVLKYASPLLTTQLQVFGLTVLNLCSNLKQFRKQTEQIMCFSDQAQRSEMQNLIKEKCDQTKEKSHTSLQVI